MMDQLNFLALNGFQGAVRNTVFPTTKTEYFSVKQHHYEAVRSPGQQ